MFHTFCCPKICDLIGILFGLIFDFLFFNNLFLEFIGWVWKGLKVWGETNGQVFRLPDGFQKVFVARNLIVVGIFGFLIETLDKCFVELIEKSSTYGILGSFEASMGFKWRFWNWNSVLTLCQGFGVIQWRPKGEERQRNR